MAVTHRLRGHRSRRGGTRRRFSALVTVGALLVLTGCGALPRDPDQTLDHIRSSKSIRVGLAPISRNERHQAEKLISRIAHHTGATPHVDQLATEPGFVALDDGKLDLMIGAFERDSPWMADVAFGPPLIVTGNEDHPVEVKAAMKNGENRWIMLVEQATREASPEAARQ